MLLKAEVSHSHASMARNIFFYIWWIYDQYVDWRIRHFFLSNCLIKLLACGARGPGFDSRPRHLNFQRLVISCFQVAIRLEYIWSDVNPQYNQLTKSRSMCTQIHGIGAGFRFSFLLRFLRRSLASSTHSLKSLEDM